MATATKTPLPPSSPDGPFLVGALIEGQQQAAFENALPRGTLVRLYSFTGGAFFAEALSDDQGRGIFHTSRPLVSPEELAALNEGNGKVGPHRFVEPLSAQTPTPTPSAPKVPAGTTATHLLMLLLLGFLGLSARARTSGDSDHASPAST